MVRSKVQCKSDNCRRWANLNSDGFCPKCVSAGIDSSNDAVSTCNICKKDINDEDSQSVGCDGCGDWFHAKCAGPAALIELVTKAQSQELLGMLLWFCPECFSSSAKTYSIGDSKCTKLPSTSPKKTMQEKAFGPICEKYAQNTCDHGISGKGCDHYHPKMCCHYIRFGPHGKRGCNKTNCDYFHPKLCKHSLKPVPQRVFTNHSCSYFHLPRTRRNAQDQRQRQLYGPRRQTRNQQSFERPGNNADYRSGLPGPQDPFLGSLIRDLIKESIQAELGTLQSLTALSQQKAPPFLPGMNHFSQPWAQAMSAKKSSGYHPTQSQTQEWTTI